VAWRFGRLLTVEGRQVLQWVLRRNCSMSPRQVFGAYLLLCFVSLLIAGGFTWWGAAPVLAFAAVELTLVGIALLIYARHAADRETITLEGEALWVEHRCGNHVERAEFRSAWVRVEPQHGEGSLVELSGQGRQVRVGRYLRPELRTPLAREIRCALRSSAVPNVEQLDSN
jgi:uncharacterized membrane protein